MSLSMELVQKRNWRCALEDCYKRFHQSGTYSLLRAKLQVYYRQKRILFLEDCCFLPNAVITPWVDMFSWTGKRCYVSGHVPMNRGQIDIKIVSSSHVETVVLMSREKDWLPKKYRISGLFRHLIASGEERIWPQKNALTEHINCFCRRVE